MRTLSFTVVASALILWGIYSNLTDNSNYNESKDKNEITRPLTYNQNATPYKKIIKKELSRKDLDQIATVINEKNVQIDKETKIKITAQKRVFEAKQELVDKQILLDQSYTDTHSSVSDIRRIQNKIIDLKNKLKVDISNTEKWDPKFVYYLMLQENYTYQEINNIKSLSENGINPEEVNFINGLIKEESFAERINTFKNITDTKRSIASVKKKEKDDFIEGAEIAESNEEKIIEMEYNHE